jgi:hypothetical protein
MIIQMNATVCAAVDHGDGEGVRLLVESLQAGALGNRKRPMTRKIESS